MANRLEFSATIDGSGFKAGIAEMERLSGTASARMARSMDLISGPKGAANVMGRSRKEYLEMVGGKPGEIAGVAQTNGRVAATMYVSALRDTFASLASGQSPVTVFLQQAPQVAQAFAMMGVEAVKAAAKWIGIGVAIVGVVAVGYWLIKRLQGIAEAQRNLRDLTDTANVSLSVQLSLLRESERAHRSQIEWLRTHTASQREFREELDQTVASMRRRFDFERQLAQARGATPAQLAQMDIQQAEAEAAALAAGAQAAQRRQQETQQAAAEAARKNDEFLRSRAAQQGEIAKKKAEEAIKVAQAVREKMQTAQITEIDAAASRAAALAGGTGFVTTARPATEGDVLAGVNVGGKQFPPMSAAQAEATARRLTDEANMVQNLRESNARAVERTRTSADRARQDAAALTRQSTEAAELLALRREFMPRIAALAGGGGGGLGAGRGDSLTSVGNFLGSTGNMIESLARQQVDLLRQIVINTQPRFAGGSVNATGWTAP